MPNSTQKRKQIEKHKALLKTHLKNIGDIMKKKYLVTQQVTLPHVALGDLREKFSYHHRDLDPYLIGKESEFVRYDTNTTVPLEIRGSDGGLLAYRLPGMDKQSVERLHSTMNRLPKLSKNTKQKGINRWSYSTSHLAVWCPYRLTPILSSEFRHHEIAHRNFIKANEAVWERMTWAISHAAPNVFEDFQRYPLPSDTERLCKAWCACVVNRGGVDVDKTNAYCDVREAQYGYSGLCSTGDYSGGGLILYEIQVIIEMNAGDIIIFPDCAVTHVNEEVVGERNSVVCFT
jgi:hypothetical protein